MNESIGQKEKASGPTGEIAIDEVQSTLNGLRIRPVSLCTLDVSQTVMED